MSALTTEELHQLYKWSIRPSGKNVELEERRNIILRLLDEYSVLVKAEQRRREEEQHADFVAAQLEWGGGFRT